MEKRTGLPVVGMVGGAEAARMTGQAALTLGQSLRVLADPARVTMDQFRAFAEGCDVITVGSAAAPLGWLSTIAEAGATVLPGPSTLLAVTGHRDGTEGVPVSSGGGILAVPVSSGGGTLAVLVARSPFGQIAVYPVTEIVRRGGLRYELVVSPAVAGRSPALERRAVAAQRLAIDTVLQLRLVGLLTVELSETLVVTGLAAWPRSAGNWTVEGARTSQYEQLLRAVLDYPLGETGPTAPVVVTARVPGFRPGPMSLDERLHHCFAADPGARVHLHGAELDDPAADRASGDWSIGYVTVLGDQVERAMARVERAVRWLQEGKQP